MVFIINLKKTFKSNASEANREPMKAYMKNKFEFLGIKSALRKQLLKEVINRHKDEVLQNTRKIIKELYICRQREFHYCAMEIMAKFLNKKYIPNNIELIENLISMNSHWDTVDFIAKHILGKYLIQFPELTEKTIKKMSDSNDMWQNRSAILFQLGYKEETCSETLFQECVKHSGSKEFFIQKAIGWALREYAKTNPNDVQQFVKSNQLAPLSIREALKHLK